MITTSQAQQPACMVVNQAEAAFVLDFFALPALGERCSGLKGSSAGGPGNGASAGDADLVDVVLIGADLAGLAGTNGTVKGSGTDSCLSLPKNDAKDLRSDACDASCALG